MVDESHSAGVVGPTGHGVSELTDTYGRVDIYTGTLGKAFGGALGGWLFDLLGISWGGILGQLATAIIGAALILWIASFFKK